MKIRLLTARAGVNFSQDRGEVIEVSDAEAVRMIEAGQAEPVRDVPVERSVFVPKRREKAAE